MKICQKADKKVAEGVFKREEPEQDVGSMKVEVNLILVKGQNEACTSPRKNSRPAREFSSPEIKLLISQENQQARRLDPTSLTEARTLLIDMTQRLSATPKDAAAEVHLVESPCLVRLP